MNEQFSIGKAFYILKNELEKSYPTNEAVAISHEYLAFLTGLSKIDRLLQKDQLLSIAQIQCLQKDLSRLMLGEPLQYITGFQWFYGNKFEVNKHVLIPRPETEELVQWIVAENKSKTNISILEIGTGSGCIAISLKKKIPQGSILSCDISTESINVAKKNALSLKADLTFIQLDFLNEELWESLPNTDLIVSNPPYIPFSEKEILDKNVRDFEPSSALFVADNDRFVFYRKIALFSNYKLKPNGSIYCEIHRDFAIETMKTFNDLGNFSLELRKDFHGNNRMIKATKN